jgi:hypothetical protein
VKGQAPVKETYLAEAEADGTELLCLLDIADTAREAQLLPRASIGLRYTARSSGAPAVVT